MSNTNVTRFLRSYVRRTKSKNGGGGRSSTPSASDDEGSSKLLLVKDVVECHRQEDASTLTEPPPQAATSTNENNSGASVELSPANRQRIAKKLERVILNQEAKLDELDLRCVQMETKISIKRDLENSSVSVILAMKEYHKVGAERMHARDQLDKLEQLLKEVEQGQVDLSGLLRGEEKNDVPSSSSGGTVGEQIHSMVKAILAEPAPTNDVYSSRTLLDQAHKSRRFNNSKISDGDDSLSSSVQSGGASSNRSASPVRPAASSRVMVQGGPAARRRF